MDCNQLVFQAYQLSAMSPNFCEQLCLLQFLGLDTKVNGYALL